MSRFELVLLSIASGVCVALSPMVARATNTNQCIADLGGILTCQNRNFLGLPNDLQGCCDGLRELGVDRCECNPAIDAVLGEEGKQIYNLEAICRFVQPTKWRKVVPFFLRPCGPLQTHQYGCQQTDVEIDGARLKSILKFQSLFADAMNENMCLDTPAFADQLATVFTPDINFNVPYGIGTYTGTVGVSEYLGMAFSGLTHGYWQNDITPDPSKPARLEVAPNGSVWITGSTVKGEFLRGLLPYQDIYLEQQIQFQGCNTLASDYSVLPTDGLRFVIESIVQTAQLSKRWGIEDICRYHTRFCADDAATRQYSSEHDCLEYLRTLPVYTPACGPNRPLNGHSIGCKLKHHFMIPANPALHCPHIGPMGIMDPNHHVKCDDASECGTDQGQSAWPPVTAVGANIPASVRAVFDQSNVGYEAEPFGCAIPSTSDAHHM